MGTEYIFFLTALTIRLIAHLVNMIYRALQVYKARQKADDSSLDEGVSRFQRDPYAPYNEILSGAHKEIEIRPYVRGAKNCRSFSSLTGHAKSRLKLSCVICWLDH